MTFACSLVCRIANLLFASYIHVQAAVLASVGAGLVSWCVHATNTKIAIFLFIVKSAQTSQ